MAISTQINDTNWASPKATVLPTAIHKWLSRQRIPISLLGFSSLALINVFVLQTIPVNPFSFDLQAIAGCLTVLLGLAIRSWSAGTLNKSREITNVGPYALVRNPLYLGSFLMMIGFCILCRDVLTSLFVAGPLVFLYWQQVRFEEVRLAAMFPTQWTSYMEQTPRFIPVRISRKLWAGWSGEQWLRNREYNAIIATSVGLIAVFVWYCVRSQA